MPHSNYATGRPRTACDKCKNLKIRCSTKRPVCDRCLRIGHTCVYSKDTITPAKVTKRFKRTHSKPRSGFEDLHGLIATHQDIASPSDTRTYSASVPRTRHLKPSAMSRSLANDELGIPKNLIPTLVDVYFRHVYNAGLLLHRESFLSSIEDGTADPHIVLSVCAWAAKFYQDDSGVCTLREHGFMEEWAKRAGELVFREAESLREANIVTHMNLCLFWFSEGSWSRAYIHKANARALIQVLGTGSRNTKDIDPFEAEIRRRRFWSHYLMECHMPSPGPPELRKAVMSRIELPWPEEDFAAGRGQPSRGDHERGIYAEMIRVLTLWADVNSFVRSLKDTVRENVATVYALDEELRDWWQSLKPAWKLAALNLNNIPEGLFAKVLLINVAYHQCLFALHAAVVPLFSVDSGSVNWNTARQLSAQIAFEHASSTSELISMTLTTSTRISAIPHFVAWSGYSACAILLTFVRSSDEKVKRRAMAQVQANGRLISEIAKYWRFARLLEHYLTNLVRAYEKHQVVLEDEPKNLALQKMSTFRIKSEFARASILGYLQVLESEGEGLIAQGEEKLDLGLEGDYQEDSSSIPSHATPLESTSAEPASRSFETMTDIGSHLQLIETSASSTSEPYMYDPQTLDEWPINTFLTPTSMPTMLELTTQPWNDIGPAFGGTGWSSEVWQHFSAPSFNNY